MWKVLSQYGTSWKTQRHIFKLNQSITDERNINWAFSYQREIVGVDPDDAEVRVVGVLTCHLLQDFQEFITVYGKVSLVSMGLIFLNTLNLSMLRLLIERNESNSVPGSSSSAKATMCSPLMSSSCEQTQT